MLSVTYRQIVTFSVTYGYIPFQFNSIQFFIIYVPSQQPQGQLQTQHSADTGNHIREKHNIKSKSNYRQAREEKHINAEK
jgi:hypothetical protein